MFSPVLTSQHSWEFSFLFLTFKPYSYCLCIYLHRYSYFEVNWSTGLHEVYMHEPPTNPTIYGIVELAQSWISFATCGINTELPYGAQVSLTRYIQIRRVPVHYTMFYYSVCVCVFVRLGIRVCVQYSCTYCNTADINTCYRNYS